MLEKTRTKNIVSEASLNFFKVPHRGQNRGSLFWGPEIENGYLTIRRGWISAENHDF